MPRHRAQFVQAIEQTGKIWKLQIALSSALCVVSALLIFFGWRAIASIAPGEQSRDADVLKLLGGMIGLLIGLVWLVTVKFLAWWNHG